MHRIGPGRVSRILGTQRGEVAERGTGEAEVQSHSST